MFVFLAFFFSSRRRHTRCALVTGVQTCALPICRLKCRTDNQLGSWLGRSAYERPRVLRKLHADCEARMGSTSRQRHVSQSPHRLSSKDWRKNVAGRIHDHRLSRRSEEHTSELQSLMRTSYAVFCLKKKNYIYSNHK